MRSKGEQTRENILIEASRLFELQGFRATSLSDLQAATGLKKGALYFHFANKNEIGQAVLERSKAELETLLDKTLVGETPGACLENFFAGILAWQAELKFCGGCIFGNIALEMGDSDTLFASFVDEVFNAWIARIAQVITAGQAAGEISSELSAEVLASHVVAATEGGIMLSRLKKNEQPLKDCFAVVRRLLATDR